MDLSPFVSENVCIKLYRRHKFKTYRGRLVSTSGHRICLFVDNRSVWITKPNWFKDSIEKVNKI